MVMRKRTDEEILREVASEVRQLFGLAEPVKKGRPRGATGTLTMWKAGDKYYRHKKNAVATGKPVSKHPLDVICLLEWYETEGFEYHFEDMTHDEYINAVKRKVKEYRGW